MHFLFKDNYCFFFVFVFFSEYYLLIYVNRIAAAKEIIWKTIFVKSGDIQGRKSLIISLADVIFLKLTTDNVRCGRTECIYFLNVCSERI